MLIEMSLLLLVAAMLRLLPVLLAPHGSGVDQWFWRAYVETVRREKVFPPRLPQFRLDEAQWYPPLFPWLLAHMPSRLFERYAGHVAAFLDLIRLSLLMLATRLLTDSDGAALVAGAVYAITPVLITYNMQLNPRGLGALMLDAAWLCLIAVMVYGASWVFWLLALVFAGLVLLTHKMTSQLFAFTALLGACLTFDVRLALMVPGAMLVALLLSGGFYLYVIRAHVDIVRFWSFNWRWLGSNPVLESPIYGELGYESNGKVYRNGLKALLRRLQFVIGFNPWVPVTLSIVILAWFSDHNFSSLEVWVFAWLAVTFLFTLTTMLIPMLRCFGQGYLYGYNASFPAALALGLSWLTLFNTWYWITITIVAILASLFALVIFFRAMRSSRTIKVDASLDAAINRLEKLPEGTVMCLPQHWHDVVAYRTRKPVAFGGHGYGFKRLQPVFPRLIIPVKELIKMYDIRYLLLWPQYVNEKFLADLPVAEIEEYGDYLIYKFKST